jgi:hypothetical protein
MTLKLQKITAAVDLPAAWDESAEEYFQRREFLTHVEIYNPCEQRYYVFSKNNSFAAGLVVYTLKLDLFTFSFIHCPLSMNIAGIPCSVSASGFIGRSDFLEQVIEQVKKLEKGFLVVLNLDFEPGIRDCMIGRTLPTIVLNNDFSSWDDYLITLRSDYRRRIRISAEHFKNAAKFKSNCTLFTEDMYQLYLDVLDHSKGKLEILSYMFFQELPEKFNLMAYYDQDKLLGWYISVFQENKFYFFLGGIDYNSNIKYHTYSNLLLGLLEEGIRLNIPVIDLGQTAEISKARLGGNVRKKWMVVHHSNWLLRKLLIAARKVLEYSEKFPAYHVFKEKQ